MTSKAWDDMDHVLKKWEELSLTSVLRTFLCLENDRLICIYPECTYGFPLQPTVQMMAQIREHLQNHQQDASPSPLESPMSPPPTGRKKIYPDDFYNSLTSAHVDEELPPRQSFEKSPLESQMSPQTGRKKIYPDDFYNSLPGAQQLHEDLSRELPLMDIPRRVHDYRWCMSDTGILLLWQNPL